MAEWEEMETLVWRGRRVAVAGSFEVKGDSLVEVGVPAARVAAAVGAAAVVEAAPAVVAVVAKARLISSRHKEWRVAMVAGVDPAEKGATVARVAGAVPVVKEVTEEEHSR
jgi:hypothetical protein